MDDQRYADLVIAVGWNQKVLIWEEDEEVEAYLPYTNREGPFPPATQHRPPS
jgi:hypothetical protein